MTCRYALTVAALTASLSVSAAGTALADTIIQIQAVSAGSFGATGVTPFDPALGTLDSVFVGISGQLSVTGSTLPNIVDNVPVPYPFQVKVTQDYFGLGGRYFHFSTPAEFTFFGNATGTGEPLIIVSQFTYGFSFTSITDLLGFTLPCQRHQACWLRPLMASSASVAIS